jgi:hypothetical protein
MSHRFVLLFVMFSVACATKPAAPTSAPTAPVFAYCPPAKFANCTLAKCERKQDGNYSCWCFEDDRYSATAWAGSQAKSCVAATKENLQSRYHPIAAYQECGTHAPVQQWAWCLGVSCTRSTDPKDPNSTANVRCECLAIPPNVPPIPYVVTTNTYSAQNCMFQYWSSATPIDVSQVTSFLQTHPGHENLKQPVVLERPN